MARNIYKLKVEWQDGRISLGYGGGYTNQKEAAEAFNKLKSNPKVRSVHWIINGVEQQMRRPTS